MVSMLWGGNPANHMLHHIVDTWVKVAGANMHVHVYVSVWKQVERQDEEEEEVEDVLLEVGVKWWNKQGDQMDGHLR